MAKDISEELYEKISKSFNAKYEKAELLGEPLHNVLARIQNGTATFRDADMFAVEVGSMMSDSMKEHMILDEMPNRTLYRNIAQKTIGTGLKDTYGLVSNIAAVIQEEMNEAAGIGIKAVKPKLEVDRVDSIVDRAVAAKSQEELDNVLTEPVETFSRQVVDDTQKANARLHDRAGLEVKVEREYDGVGLHDGADVCDWCVQRAGTWTYDKAMAAGVFERHEGCGCIIDYTSKKGERTRSTGKYSGFNKILNPKEKESRLIEWMNKQKKEVPLFNKSGIINIQIDTLVPCLKDTKTGQIVDTVVSKVTNRADLKGFNKNNGWYVNWKNAPKEVDVYRLQVKGDSETQGLIGIRPDDSHKAVYMHWAVTAPHNNPLLVENKKYEGVGGHLFAIAAQESINAGYGGALYGFAANKELVELYTTKFGAKHLPIEHPYEVFFDEKAAKKILKEYTYEYK